MSEDGDDHQAPGEGGRLMRWAFRHLAGPAECAGRGAGRLAAGPRGVETRPGRAQAFTREQRERKRAAREATGAPELAGSAVGVAGAAAADPAGALRPGRRGRAVDVQLA